MVKKVFSKSNGAASGGGLFNAVQKEQHDRELVDRLRDIGLDQYIELPQIAVMGDTSSGKSSLLSALSGVSFPSSDQLTTRCPTQLILSRGSAFKGTVRLHRFQSNCSEHQDTIESMDDVPGAIERLTTLLVKEGQSISDDAIVIELSGPTLPNLTLTDLPGLVRTVSDGEDVSIIPRIRDMVNRYMKQSCTIIIAVVPATVDFHNTEILQAAQEADPEGSRTIGIVTKIDLVDAGAERAVHDLLLNKKKKMTLGYHAVKGRSQKDLNDGMTLEHAKQREQDFFTTHDYWHHLPQKLWGVDRLTDRLVEILQMNIRRALPSVIKEIADQLTQANGELQSLGSPLDSPAIRRRVFSQSIERFLRPLHGVLKGDYDGMAGAVGWVDAGGVDVRLRARIRHCEEAFEHQVQLTKETMPGFPDHGDDTTIQVGDLVFVTNDDGHEKVTKVLKLNDQHEIVCRDSGDEWVGQSRYRVHPLNPLRRFIVANRGDEIPIFTPYSVFCSILRQWVDTWEQPTMELVKNYRKLTLDVATRIVADLNTSERVHEYLLERVTTSLDELRIKAEDEMRQLLQRERRPFTQDPQLVLLFTQMLRPGLETIVAQRLPQQGDGLVNFSDVVNLLTELSRSNDEHDTVLMDSALRAYFQIAVKRFVDHVPMHLNATMLEGFLHGMQEELQSTTDERLERLLTESMVTQSRRADLIDKCKTLHAAKQHIEDLA